jgi:hypothetical protein
MDCCGGRPALGPMLALRGAGLGALPPGADIFTDSTFSSAMVELNYSGWQDYISEDISSVLMGPWSRGTSLRLR